MKFHQDKLDKLKCCMKKEKIEEWQSHMSTKKFVEKVLQHPRLSDLKIEVDLEIFCDKKIDRCDVRKFVNNKDANTLAKVLFILAWGGMPLPNAKQALESYQNCWKKIVDDMLEVNLYRDEAYKRFHCLVKDKKLTHMGPAYFTKLIFFLAPKHNSYIMDQWTARSMNLLRKSNKYKIHLKPTAWRKSNGSSKKFRNFYVDKIKNDVSIYRVFCEDLERLAEYLGRNPEETEKIIFSKGGRVNKMGCWRRFVLEGTSKTALGDAANSHSLS